MANISATIMSKSLGFRTHIEVIHPYNPHELATPTGKILYLLHGLSDDCTAWARNTRISAYAEKHGYVVIMPEVQRSFYSNMKHGSKYLTYVSEELPAICERLFNIRHTPDNTFVAGLSMGGYGAAKVALTRPDFYAACASFSGAVDMKNRVAALDDIDTQLPEARAILGEGLDFPDADDLFFLADKAVKLANKPRMLVTCGDADFLLDDNRRFDAHLNGINYGHTYMEWPGDHTWDFWEECLPHAFEFFGHS